VRRTGGRGEGIVRDGTRASVVNKNVIGVIDKKITKCPRG
jgi:hypothetical protein